MGNLREKIRKLIEHETQNGRFSILNTTTNVDLLQQIIKNYKRTNGIREVEEGEKLPRKGELVFVAAPTGAGKDSLVARICHQNPEKRYIELNMDIFRHYFPQFIGHPEQLADKNFAQMTNEFAYEIYYTIQEMLLQEFPGTNIIITGTLRETDWVEETFKRFKSDKKTDYDVKIACLAVPKKESAISVIGRYIGIVNAQKGRLEYYPGTARYTSLQYHDETYERFPANLEYFQKKFEEEPGKMIDCIEVHRRGKTVFDLEDDTKIYSSEEEGDRGRGALAAVMQLRLKPYNVRYEEFALIAYRIKENKDYLKSQKTLKETIKDLAVILNYPHIIQRIDRMLTEQDDQDEPDIK
ncbi:MAG: zeta toxin family protein [Clostridia bacterium]|nr:zeta toxin family protein [Clostridia bacterium]